MALLTKPNPTEIRRQTNLLAKIKSENQTRQVTVIRQNVDAEKRTVEIAFSSETPVPRWYGNEILDHSPKSVDLTRMKSGGAILVDHDSRDHVGVVDRISIDDDRVGRLTARFGNSQRASEIFQDIVDGIRQNVSVGYQVKEAKLEKTSDDGEDDYRVVSWVPVECSICAVPADPKTGVGRNLQREDSKMEVDEVVKPEEKTPVVSVEDIRKKEMNRIRIIRRAGKRFKQEELADTYIDDGKTLDEFRGALLDKIDDDTRVMKPVTQLELTPNEVKRYSLFKAIRAYVKHDWSGAEFERECSAEIADRIDREPKGFFVPFDIQTRQSMGMETRVTMAKATVGDLIGTDHLGSSFIELLRSSTTIGALGVRFMTGLRGDVEIPRQDTASTFGWIADDSSRVLSDVDIGSITLTPTTLTGGVDMSRRLMKQADPSVEGIILNDLVRGAALTLDIAAYQGTGALEQPTGIYQTTGILTQEIAKWATTKVPDFGEVVGFETSLATADAAFGSLSYVVAPDIYGGLKTTFVDPGSNGMPIIFGGEMNGYPVVRTNNISAGNSCFANWNDLIIGMWGILDVKPDVATDAAKDGLILRVFQDVDLAVRHPESFCIGVIPAV